MNTTVCFCHGRDSGPWGTKIRRLALVAEQLGCRVVSVDDRETPNPDERVRRLLAQRDVLGEAPVLVGSSMGGYVAAVAAGEINPVGVFLMAPAFGMPGYAVAAPSVPSCRLAVVQGWDDTVVPVASVLDFARRHRAMLHLVADDHLLRHELEYIVRLFADFLAGCLGRELPPSRELIAAL